MELAGIIWDAATCLFGCGKAHAAYVCKLEENLSSLQRKWGDLHNMSIDLHRRINEAEDSGEMRRTNEVSGWLQHVQNLQEVIENIQLQGSEESDIKCLSGCCLKNCISRYKLGKKVMKVLNDVDDLLAKGIRFDVIDIAFKLPLRPVIKMPCVETVGLDLMFKQVWNSIEENIGIIGLYGMGGVGKTTLLKIIHNEFEKRKDDFTVVLWVVVSKDCDTNKIMTDIKNRLGIKDSIWNESSPDQRATTIYQVLRQKKYALMLDDVWGKLELEKVGVPHPKDTEYKSKVLFTTRFEDVCAKMQAQKKFKVECLSEQEALDLFYKKAGEESLKSHREIPMLAKEMVKECGGLPLALITVGSAMAGVKSVEAWRQAKSDFRNSTWIASDLEDTVFRILKFSFDKLPDEAHKRCFLYCALYPEDHEIRVDGLIDRWISEGFLTEDKASKSIYDMYEQGESILQRLKLSCMLEGIEYCDRWWSTVKMHDVIRDMALWLVRDQDGNKDKIMVQEEALATSEMNSERLNAVKRISIINICGSWQIPTCPNLHTLCVQHGKHRVDITDYSNIQYMIKLKVLDLSGICIKRLPPEIGHLINLEFLNLSRTSIENRLPIELKNLKSLRVLLMEDYAHHLEMIPLEVIGSLVQLKVFRFTSRLKKSQGEMAFLEKLESLQKLEELCIQLNTITAMHKLFLSAKLQGCSRHFWLHRIKEPLEMTSLLGSLSTKKHLEYVSLWNVNNIMEASFITNACHFGKLRWVRIGYCDSLTHLTWLTNAPCVEFLYVTYCYSIREVVKEVENVNGWSNGEDDNGVFSNLKHLCLYGLPKLKSIYNGTLNFPFIKSIDVFECRNLRKLPLNSNSAKNSLIAIKGNREWWNNLEWNDTSAKDLLHSKFQPLYD
ncbi:hypothetical protein RJT34_04346 [Clitoria ternatea]|uniref:NB-ARC domain-containing protein n=1 Tax=Clitoria ternatea TaxID=43366 RepID=A0AAN9Q618_CLITE